MKRLIGWVLLCAGVLAGAATNAADDSFIILQSTTSTRNSGLKSAQLQWVPARR